MLTFRHRKYNKQVWKILYRRWRITNREIGKVAQDQLLFGTGHYVFDDEGLPKHIPPEDIYIPAPKV